MAQIIEIKIQNKIAKTDFSDVVSYNNVYRLKFVFDEEWAEYPHRVAVVYWEGGGAEVLFTENECDMPQINSLFSENVYVGVYSIQDGKRIASSLVPIRCLPGAYKAPPAKKTDSLQEQVLDMLNKFGDPHKFVTVDTKQTVTGQKTFTENLMVGDISGGVELDPALGAIVRYSENASKPIKLPNKMGTFALTDDIPDLTDLKKQSGSAIQPGDVTVAYTPMGERDRKTFRLTKGAQVEFHGFDSELIDDDFLSIEGTRLKAEGYTTFQSGDITLIGGQNIGIAQEGNKITFVGADIPDISGLAEKTQVQEVESAAQKAQETADSAKSAAQTAQTTAEKAQETADSAKTAAQNAQSAADSAKTAAQNAQNSAKASLQPEDVTIIAEQDPGNLNLPLKKGTRIFLHGFSADLVSDNALSIDGTRLKASETSQEPISGDITLKGDGIIRISQVAKEFVFSAYLPENHVTTDTEQEISGAKTFTGLGGLKVKDEALGNTTQVSPNMITVGFGNKKASSENPVEYLVISPSGFSINEDFGGESGRPVEFSFPEKSGTIALKEDIPTDYVTKDTAQDITGSKTFKGNVTFGDFNTRGLGVNSNGIGFSVYVDGLGYQVNFQERAGTVALDEDIPNWARTESKPEYTWSEIKGTNNFVTTDTNQSISGEKTFTSSVTVGSSPNDGIQINPTTKSITVLSGNSSKPIKLPDKMGTFALTSDIPTLPSWIGSSKPSYTWSEIGSKPTNFVTTDTKQEISGEKTFTSVLNVKNEESGTTTTIYPDSIYIGAGNKEASEERPVKYLNISPDGLLIREDFGGSSGRPIEFSFPEKSGTIALKEDIPTLPSWIGSSKPSYTWSEIGSKPTNFVTTDTQQTISGEKTFTKTVTIDGTNAILTVGSAKDGYVQIRNDSIAMGDPVSKQTSTYRLPDRGGTIALTSDIPSVPTDKDIFLKAHPVGSYYISSEKTSPKDLFGGSWTAITGRFLYCNAGTGTGGSNSVTLTVNNLPSHNHSLDSQYFASRRSANSGYGNLMNGDASNDPDMNYGLPFYHSSEIIKNTGGGQAFNNMPAYQTVYAWRRTA